MGTAVHMSSGLLFDLETASADQVHWPDIAEFLSKEPRFAGATLNTVYSVAQHCHLVGSIAENLASRAFSCDEMIRQSALAGHIHDAHEFATRDIPTPTRQLMSKMAGEDFVGQIQSRIDSALYPSCGLKWPLTTAIRDIVLAADQIALATEKRDLLSNSKSPWGQFLPQPLPDRLKPWPCKWLDSMERWWTRFQSLAEQSCPDTFRHDLFK